MATHDYVISNQSFPSTRTDINNVLQAIVTNNSNATAPSTTYANMIWYDTTNNKLYIRNEDNDAWIELFVLDQTGDHLEKIGNTITLDGSGNCGIGLSDPDTPLEVQIGSSGNALKLSSSADGASVFLAFEQQESGTKHVRGRIRAASNGVEGGLIFETGASSSTSERLRIDNSGNVGIGTTTPTSFGGNLVASGTGSIINARSSSGTSAIGLWEGSSSRFFLVSLNGSDGLAFVDGDGSSERMRILSGGGLTFNGDTSADNALDDYEIGSWTPAYAVSGGSFSYGLQIGTYVKIGELVTATCRIRGQRSGGSGAVTMSGLPYTSRNISNLHAACSLGFTKSWNTSPKGAFVGTNATTISFKKAGSTSALSNFSDDLDAADAATAGTSNNDLILSVTYVAN